MNWTKPKSMEKISDFSNNCESTLAQVRRVML